MISRRGSYEILSPRGEPGTVTILTQIVGNTAVRYLDLESVLAAQYAYVYNHQLHEQVG